MCNHVKKYEEDLLRKEHLIDEWTERFIITCNDSDTDDDDDDYLTHQSDDNRSYISGIHRLPSDEDE